MVAPVIALLVIALVSLLAVRVGSTALMMTGISWDTASFQAYSAFFGVGFTTKEAELVVNHPVRRRIIRDLILAGNVGLTSALATLIVTLLQSSSGGNTVLMLGWLIGGLIVMLFTSRLTVFQKVLDHIIQRTLERTGMVRALDYELLLRIQHGYVVSEIEVPQGTYLAGRTLRESRPWIVASSSWPSTRWQNPFRHSGPGRHDSDRRRTHRLWQRIRPSSHDSDLGTTSDQKERTMNLTNQVCAVTGGAKGIGLATAQALLARGARVALLDLENITLENPHALSIRCDVSRAADVQSAIDQITEQLGTIAVWVNNAGLARHRWIPDYTEEEIDLMLAVNLKGTILGSQAALKAMIPHRRGHIINVISTASLRGIPSETVYCAAKWGVRGFTQGLAEEAAAHRIRVTAILPGGVDTAFWNDASQRQAPKQLFLKPEHIANGIVSCLEMDDFCVPRELVLRSLDDSDFSVKPE